MVWAGPSEERGEQQLFPYCYIKISSAFGGNFNFGLSKDLIVCLKHLFQLNVNNCYCVSYLKDY